MSEAEIWAGPMGLKWAQYADALDRQLEPAGEAGLDRLRAMPGEAILDLGCGSGATTAKIAAAVGPKGMVTGVDVSADQIAAAQVRCAVPQARFVVGDAETYPFGTAAFDAMFSRFGCMFFDRPDRAYANLHQSLKPGGRIALVVWADIRRNPWAAIPAAVGAELLGPVEPVPPGTPGPFSWADPETFRSILGQAGFRDLSWHETAVTLPVGEDGEAEPAERAARMLMRIGPLARRLLGNNAVEAEVLERLKQTLAEFVEDGWVRMPGLVWVIQARA